MNIKSFKTFTKAHDHAFQTNGTVIMVWKGPTDKAFIVIPSSINAGIRIGTVDFDMSDGHTQYFKDSHDFDR